MSGPHTIELTEKLRDLPAKPGVYLMKDASGKIIYIGKAKVLRNRVRSYFVSAPELHPKVAALREKIADFELMVTDTEVEALILEANLVKLHRPHYNINLKDDKRFPYLELTRDDDFPRLIVTRTRRRDNGIYFGPYANVRAMRETHRMILRLFKLRTCNLRIPHPKGAKYKVCLQYHIKRCPGPCAGLFSSTDYDREVRKVTKLLQGKSASLVEELRAEMTQLSLQQAYEDAAAVRDQVKAIETIMQKQKVSADRDVDRDIVAFARAGVDLAAVVLQLREGLLIGRQNYQLKANKDDGEEDISAAFLKQYYLNSTFIPEEIYCSFKCDDQQLIVQWLAEKRGSKVALSVPQRGEKLRIVEMAEANARLLLGELLAQRREQAEKLPFVVASLQKDLYLSRAPITVCAFDISNLGSSDAVGSMVFFKNGRPLKNNYRHFKIRTVTGQDDFAMMREVVSRYFTHVLEDEAEMPDLCIIDGGRGQLSAALSALEELGIDDLQICGLAKKFEEIVLPDEKKALTLPRTSSSLKLMQRIRDEAHRFAVTYHKKLRGRKIDKSLLDEIAGIGPKRKEQLLKALGSVDAVAAASDEELLKALRNKAQVAKVREFFQRS
jgi:excinuclease ABC subunit C